MASPLRASKTKVDLAAPRVRGSRIRRDPPPAKAKEVSPEKLREREQRVAIAGVVGVALALSLIILGISEHWGWSMADYTIQM